MQVSSFPYPIKKSFDDTCKEISNYFDARSTGGSNELVVTVSDGLTLIRPPLEVELMENRAGEKSAPCHFCCHNEYEGYVICAYPRCFLSALIIHDLSRVVARTKRTQAWPPPLCPPLPLWTSITRSLPRHSSLDSRCAYTVQHLITISQLPVMVASRANLVVCHIYPESSSPSLPSFDFVSLLLPLSCCRLVPSARIRLPLPQALW